MICVLKKQSFFTELQRQKNFIVFEFSTLKKPGICHKIKVRFVCTGYAHSMALSDTDQVYSWGDNQRGQCGLDPDSRAYKCIRFPRLIQGLSEYKIVRLKAEANNSHAKSDKHEHWIWGDNGFGQCTLENRKKPTRIDYKHTPHRIDKIFYAQTGRKIENVFLGNTRTYITPIA